MSQAENYQSLADYVYEVGRRRPEKAAVRFPVGRRGKDVVYSELTFGDMVLEMDAYRRGFAAIGIKAGMRVSFMVRPSLEFLPMILALFKSGAVPVLIDPGMGKKNLLRCLETSKPDAFIGIPRAHFARKLFPAAFKDIKIFVTIGGPKWLQRLWPWGGYREDDIQKKSGDLPEVDLDSADLAAIIFTTGSTGPPKGVCYTHGMFLAQRDCLKDNFDLSEDDIDMPAFALFSIWSLAMGCTIVIPDMDQTRPALVNPERIIEAIKQNDVTFSFGSPALWNTVSRYCAAHHISLPSLEKVIMAGAPIPFFLHERMLGKILKDGADIFTPYGATECLPVSNFQGSKVLAETAEKTAAGQGYCVGQALPGNEVKVIAIDDGVISDFKDIKELPQGEIGEIIVKSDIVSRSYYELPEQTALHKIYEGDKATDPFWHRIGDLAYLDDQGRIWMCGRKSHRVVNGDKCWYTVCCEAICNNHPSVYRSALVGIGKDRYKQTPVMLLEAEEGDSIPLEEVKKLAAESDLTKDIKHFLVHPSFPVDIRHNAKIFREKLAPWAEERLDL